MWIFRANRIHLDVNRYTQLAPLMTHDQPGPTMISTHPRQQGKQCEARKATYVVELARQTSNQGIELTPASTAKSCSLLTALGAHDDPSPQAFLNQRETDTLDERFVLLATGYLPATELSEGHPNGLATASVVPSGGSSCLPL